MVICTTFKVTSPIPTSTLNSITIPNTISVQVGKTATITPVTCKNTSGSTMSCPTLTWGSGNNSIVTVSSGGIITGVSAGTMTVNCWDTVTGIASNLCQVTVTAAPTNGTTSWWCDTSTKVCTEKAISGGYATKALCDETCSGTTNGGVKCQTGKINIFGTCYKTSDVAIAAGAVVLLMMLSRK